MVPKNNIYIHLSTQPSLRFPSVVPNIPPTTPPLIYAPRCSESEPPIAVHAVVSNMVRFYLVEITTNTTTGGEGYAGVGEEMKELVPEPEGGIKY